MMHTVTATDEALAEVIEAWVRLEIPGDQVLAGQIAHKAMSLRAAGATIDDTCEWTRSLARSLLRHPSHGYLGRHLSVVGAPETT